MPTTSPEYQIPQTPEIRQETTPLGNGEQLDFHKSKLDRLTTDALGAATQTAASLEDRPAPETVERLTPSEEVLQFGRDVIKMRGTELDENLLAEDNPRRLSYLDDTNRNAA